MLSTVPLYIFAAMPLFTIACCADDITLQFCQMNHTNYCKGSLICIVLIMSYSSLGAQVWHVLTRDHTVLPATHTFVDKWNEP